MAALLGVQAVFLATGVFSTCAAQAAFYAGAGDQRAMLLPLCNYLGMMLSGLVPTSSPSTPKGPEPKPEPPAAAGPNDEPERTGAEGEPPGWAPPDHLT